MAEGLLRHLAMLEGMDIEVKSAGVSAWHGGSMSDNSQKVLEQRGIKFPFSSQSVDESLMAWADLVLTMTFNHKRMLSEQYPQMVDKVYTLKEYVADQSNQKDISEELDRYLTELQLKHSLGEKLTDQDHKHLLELKQQLDSLDIADPFGSSLEAYQACGEELELAISKLLLKLKNRQE